MFKKLGWVGLGAALGVVGSLGAGWWYLRDAMK